ncbi:uncharacterized protein LOC143867816 [Tasmannia lanceolata]|uniref:uncharacterized protein LOC143867816 n=1 Tax=Tasmannia lanceolata TaxID=3420 RepID=UPI00406468EE
MTAANYDNTVAVLIAAAITAGIYGYIPAVMTAANDDNTVAVLIAAVITAVEDNKHTSPNYVDWKRILTLVLTAVKVYWVLTTEAPELHGLDAPQDFRDRAIKWHEDDQMAECYILQSMSNVLQQQHVGMASSMDIMHNLRKMFGEQNRTARHIAIKGLVSTKMVEGTLVRDHMLKMIGYLNELEVLGAMLDGESQVDMVLASLPPSFNDFVMNYQMSKLSMMLIELLNHLQSTEDL